MFPYIAGQAAIPIMSLFFPQMLIGYYAFGWIFYSGIIMVSNAISSVILPKVSGLESKEATKVLKKAFGLYTPVVIFGCIACIFLSETFISIFFPAYLPGLPVFVPLVCFGLLIGYLQIYRGYFSGTGKTGKLIAVTSIQNGLLLIVSFISMKVTFS
jgi:O-antigen/teichoic acid export membrane protein